MDSRMLPLPIRKRPIKNNIGELKPIVATRPFEIVHMDFRGPLPVSANGNRYIIAFIDAFTHWIEAIPIAKADAKTTANAFYECIIARHSCPERIMTDNGKQFTSSLFRHLAVRMGIIHLLTAFYHPATNGKIERFYRFLNETIAVFKMEERQDWEELFQVVLMAYRMNEVRTIGASPFRMLYGREPNLPTDKMFGVSKDLPSTPEEYKATRLHEVWDKAIDILYRTADATKEYYDSSHQDLE